MNATLLPTGTEVKCTAHNGAHSGRVVAVIGATYGIRWNGSVSVPRTAEERAFMKNLSKSHSLASVNPGDVTPA